MTVFSEGMGLLSIFTVGFIIVMGVVIFMTFKKYL